MEMQPHIDANLSGVVHRIAPPLGKGRISAWFDKGELIDAELKVPIRPRGRFSDPIRVSPIRPGSANWNYIKALNLPARFRPA